MSAAIKEIRGAIITSGGGVVSGDDGNTVVSLQDVPISTTLPDDGQVLEYNGGTGKWTPTDLPPAPSFADAIIPAGVINGTNVTFTLPQAPSPPSSLILVRNGATQIPGPGNDFTLSGITITYTLPLGVGPPPDQHICWYRH